MITNILLAVGLGMIALGCVGMSVAIMIHFSGEGYYDR